MDAYRLRLLRELGDRGSVAAVASALFVTPSAVSQQLAALQHEFEVPLTERSGRALRLTPAGEALATASVKVEIALAEADEAVTAFLAADERAVTIGSLPSVALVFLPRLLADPPAPLRVTDVDVSVDRFPSQTADHDLVIAHRLPDASPWPDRLTSAPLFAEPLDLVLPLSHPLARAGSIRPHDLRGERWLSAHADFPLAGVLDHLGALIGEKPVITHEINDFPLLAAAVRAGAGIGMLPRFTSAPLLDDDLVLRPISGALFVRHVDVLARGESLARSSVRSVFKALRRIAHEIQQGQ
ncbi:MAG TPA: LysR family transcriptional regulator [Humibacter sp.]|jgi:DNA-binding transcriptional LysR family regulator|nr:LysR family transcriptional regulator [Humibacter sp.]